MSTWKNWVQESHRNNKFSLQILNPNLIENNNQVWSFEWKKSKITNVKTRMKTLAMICYNYIKLRTLRNLTKPCKVCQIKVHVLLIHYRINLFVACICSLRHWCPAGFHTALIKVQLWNYNCQFCKWQQHNLGSPSVPNTIKLTGCCW